METTFGMINHVLPRSFVDGPGNRAVVFVQGCNFHCLYCHNPFTINFCSDCGICVQACPQGALRMENGRVTWDRNRCVECDTCIKTCPSFSSPRVSRYTPQALWAELAPLQAFTSGVSISGGEVSLQIPFITAFFEQVKRHSRLTTLIETNGYAGPQAYLPLLPVLDMAMVDLKAGDDQTHERLTGKPLAPVLETIQFLHAQGKLYAVQQVIAPGFTEEEGSMRRTAQLLAGIDPGIRLRLLRFRPHGTSGAAAEWPSPSDESMENLMDVARACGLAQVERSL